MRLTTTDDPQTREKILCLHITQSDLAGVDFSDEDKKTLEFCENDAAISSTLLKAAVVARKIEKKYRTKQFDLGKLNAKERAK